MTTTVHWRPHAAGHGTITRHIILLTLYSLVLGASSQPNENQQAIVRKLGLMQDASSSINNHNLNDKLPANGSATTERSSIANVTKKSPPLSEAAPSKAASKFERPAGKTGKLNAAGKLIGTKASVKQSRQQQHQQQQLERLLALAANAAEVIQRNASASADNPTMAAEGSRSGRVEAGRDREREREKERAKGEEATSQRPGGANESPASGRPQTVRSSKSPAPILNQRKSPFAHYYGLLDDHNQRPIEAPAFGSESAFGRPLGPLPPNTVETAVPGSSTGDGVDLSGFDEPSMRARALGLSAAHPGRGPQRPEHLHDHEAPLEFSLGESDDNVVIPASQSPRETPHESPAQMQPQQQAPAVVIDASSGLAPEDRPSLHSPVEGSGASVFPNGERGHSIRVVFNNNPQFIIGRESTSGLDLANASNNILTKRSRSSATYSDDYHADESRLDETKMSETKVAAPSRETKTACDKHRHQAGKRPNFEQIDLFQEQVPVQQAPVSKTKESPSKASPLAPTPPPPVVQETQQPVQPPPVKTQEPLDEQVITPFDQVVKSGLRPPLRMVISMRNKNGDVMKVPINLQGSSIKQEPQPADVGQMQITFEPQVIDQQQPVVVAQVPQQVATKQVDENTPIGGDVFDPSIVKPFSKTPSKANRRHHSKMTKVFETPIVQEVPKTIEPPQPPVEQQQAIVPEPIAPQQLATEPPPPIKEPPPVSIPQTKEIPPPAEAPPVAPQVPIKEPEPAPKAPVPQVSVQEPQGKSQVPTKTDCADEQGQVDEPVVSQEKRVQQDDEGLVQMLVPKLTSLHNKTFATMFMQFQKALTEQMQSQQRIDQQQQQQQSKQFQDDQEDLMVAMMAANLTGYGSAPRGHQHMTMTVIKPPKGTSIEEAIAAHSKDTDDPNRTVAILHSIQSKVRKPGVMFEPAQAPQPNTTPAEPRPQTVDVQLRRPMGQLMPPATDPESDIDPDGFSSSSHVAFASRLRESRGAEKRKRLRRSAGHNDNIYGKQLEPADRLSSGRPRQLVAKRRATSEPKPAPVRATASTKAPAKRPTRRGASKRGRSRANKKSAGKGETFIAAASQSNEVTEDPDEEDEPDAADSSNEGATAPSDSADDDGNDLSDEADEMSGGFDSDDEPYNQGASSERDYNNPTSFEIPQIDINPDTLKQKGCKTVLREVQEIPLNGLGAVKSDGSPGSGYDSSATGRVGRRVKRQASNQNLINSRKVTSIVMTKECHFPNDSAEKPASSSSAAKTTASASGKSQRSGASHSAHEQTRPDVGHPVSSVSMESTNRARLSSPRSVYHGAAQQKYQQAAQQLPPTTSYSPSPWLQTATVQPAAGPIQLNGQYLMPLGTFNPDPNNKRNKVTILQPMPAPMNAVMQQQVPAISSIRRRSVGPAAVAAVAAALAAAKQAPASASAKREDDFYEGAASRRNEVVARKLYKPPSDDDPYHTLSYSSQTGLDPDMDQDDDDGAIMGPDDPQESSGSNNKNRRSPGNRRASAKSANKRQKMRETLSDEERRALMDPNYEDTDPIVRGGSSSNKQRSRPQGERLRQGQQPVTREAGDDADESDSDLADETRPARGIQVHRGLLERNHSARMVQRPASDQNNKEQNHRPLRFGKSFKMEHQVDRPEPQGLMKQLRELAPGKQGFVRYEGVEPRQAGKVQTPAASHANQLRKSSPMVQPAGKSVNQQRIEQQPAISRRESVDPDENDEGDDDDDEREHSPASSGSSRVVAGDGDSDDSPDADPDYNPKEGQLPASTKPKKTEKTFAYVHRDLPKKGSKNPDDFAISYGRGNMQTEQEDYDSDRENNEPHGSNGAKRRQADDDREEESRAPADTRQITRLSAPGKTPTGRVFNPARRQR